MPKPPPSFLTLPPDLRLRIYNLLLVSPTPIKGPTARQHQSETYNIHTSILRVNRQTHTEARHVFLGLNTFHITSSQPSALQATEQEEGSGAFEPPLQLKDLSLVRSLEVDLVYWGRRGAERYITSLSFLLREVRENLTSLKITADARPYTPSTAVTEESAWIDELDGEHGSLDVQKFLVGFQAASASWRFQDALAALEMREVELRFDFAEAHFDFVVERGVLGKSGLAWVAGQVLVARTEIGIMRAMEELEEREVEGHVMGL